MGSFVDFACKNCHYEEKAIGIGRGRNELPYLALFRCDHCHSIGSTWVHANRVPVCGNCYHDGLTLLPDDSRGVNCPKCGEPAKLTPKEGGWE